MNDQANDPLNFMRGLWGNMGLSLPGMVTPTFNLEELDKRIADLKAVEGWLRMNLSMLQMTIQGLEMQRTTVSTVQAMGQMASDAARSMHSDSDEQNDTETPFIHNVFSEAAMWPWQMMQQVQEQMQQATEETQENTPETQKKPATVPKKPRTRKTKKT